MGLRNIRLLLRNLGDPHKKFSVIHVAGTNGKGSTCAYIASVLTAAGYRVGLYTSPHLVRFNERIRVQGKCITDKEIIRITRRLKPTIQKTKATFFEATTAMMFQHFAEQKVDIAVIETGMGGRLDATNVVRPLVSVITTIGMDHTEHLGKTLSAIAFEKGGIIKSRCPVVVGRISPAARKVLAAIALQKKSRLINAMQQISVERWEGGLQGDFQVDNIKTAVAALRALPHKYSVDRLDIIDGLRHVSRRTNIHGRLEVIQKDPIMIGDVAHNPQAISRLSSSIRRIPHNRLYVIFGVMKDKAYGAMLATLHKNSPVIIATAPHYDRALPIQTIVSQCKAIHIPYVQSTSVKHAIDIAISKARKNDLIVITGSHYVVGEAYSVLKIQIS